ncbi:hypothetical protein [Hymenobacter aerophilus]|uniref:hypothetical protein n=1 Tax=Hymenobacter aerophilus TaxID=119644 RepID=UPI0003704569|nr:hypothetical protein [Hymenobacter aerophilus]
MTFLPFLPPRGRHAGLLAGLLTAATAALAPSGAFAQKYITAAGLRIGGGQYGLSVQQKILPKATLEGLALASSRELSATVLAERHFGILGPSLNYYLGAGGHLGHHKDDGTFGGFDAIIGAEYKVAFVPLVLSVDFKPTVEINSADWARFPTAFSVRYIIIKEKTSFLGGIFDGKDKKKSKPKKKDKNKGGGLFDF